jgi:hypothetical protein
MVRCGLFLDCQDFDSMGTSMFSFWLAEQFTSPLPLIAQCYRKAKPTTYNYTKSNYVKVHRCTQGGPGRGEDKYSNPPPPTNFKTLVNKNCNKTQNRGTSLAIFLESLDPP